MLIPEWPDGVERSLPAEHLRGGGGADGEDRGERRDIAGMREPAFASRDAAPWIRCLTRLTSATISRIFRLWSNCSLRSATVIPSEASLGSISTFNGVDIVSLPIVRRAV